MKNKKDFYQVSLKVFLKNNKGEVLALKAVNKGSLAGFYDFPGGRIDANEFKVPFREIIKREIKEEVGDIKYDLAVKPIATGRHVIPKKFTKNKKDIHVIYLFFEAKYLGGKIKLSREHTGYRWLNLKEIKMEEYFKSGILEGLRMWVL